MRIRLSTGKLMLVVVLLAACLALGKRIWFSEWAPFYHDRYQASCRWVVTLQQNQASYRSAGETDKVRQNERVLEIAVQERRDLFWKWVKALILDES